MLKTVLFDLGNVLFEFCHDRMCRQISEVAGCPVQTVHELLFVRGLLKDLETGRLSEAECAASISRELGCPLLPDALFEAASDLFTPAPGMSAGADLEHEPSAS